MQNNLRRAFLYGVGLFLGIFGYNFFGGGPMDWGRVFMVPLIGAAIIFMILSLFTKRDGGSESKKEE